MKNYALKSPILNFLFFQEAIRTELDGLHRAAMDFKTFANNQESDDMNPLVAPSVISFRYVFLNFFNTISLDILDMYMHVVVTMARTGYFTTGREPLRGLLRRRPLLPFSLSKKKTWNLRTQNLWNLVVFWIPVKSTSSKLIKFTKSLLCSFEGKSCVLKLRKIHELKTSAWVGCYVLKFREIRELVVVFEISLTFVKFQN